MPHIKTTDGGEQKARLDPSHIKLISAQRLALATSMNEAQRVETSFRMTQRIRSELVVEVMRDHPSWGDQEVQWEVTRRCRLLPIDKLYELRLCDLPEGLNSQYELSSQGDIV